MRQAGLTAFAILLIGLGTPGVSAGEEGVKSNPVMAAKAAREAMKKAAVPGPHHARLARMAGAWKAVTRDSSGPGKPRVSVGTAKMSMILGGRFLVHEFKGISNGKSFEGMGVSGYDNIRQKYVDIWMDDMMTSITSMEGEWNEDTRTLESVGEALMPNGQRVKMRSLSRDVSDDEVFFEMFVTGPKGKEKKVFEITYTRIISQ